MISYMPLMRTLEKKGMSLTELAVQMGLNRNGFRQVMNRGCFLKVSTLLSIADFLSCGVSDLISWQEGKGIENSTKFVSVDWQVLDGLCKENKTSLSALAVKLGYAKNKFTMAKTRGSSVSPVDVEKICEALGVEKGLFVK